MNISRRRFLQLVGAGGLGTAGGWWVADTIRQPLEYLIPYLTPPEDLVPGIDSWYRSVCALCDAGCGIQVRIREGRAKKIEGNPLHPVNQGGLCPRGQAGLQLLYNPDRLRAPLLRRPDRPKGPPEQQGDAFVEIGWEQALSLLAERLAPHLAEPADERAVQLLGRPQRGHLEQLFRRFMGHFGSDNYWHYRFDHPHALEAANRLCFNAPGPLYYDIGNCNFLLSFGADLLGGGLSPVHYNLAYGRMRGGRPSLLEGAKHQGANRGYMVQVEPRLSLTGKNADEWLPVAPGREGELALGLAHLLLARGHYRGADRPRWQALLGGYDPDTVAARTGVAAERLERLADEFAGRRPALALAGGSACAHTNGVAIQVAVNLLNLLAGNPGQAGGLLRSGASPLEDADVPAPPPTATLGQMAGLIDEIEGGRLKLLLTHEVNPLFSLPAALGLEAALSRLPFMVSLSPFMDETSALADLILPLPSYLERWDDDAPAVGVGLPVASIAQPVVAPLYATRPAGDILLALARQLAGAGEAGRALAAAMPWPDSLSMLKEGWQKIYRRQQAPDPAGFEPFWHALLQAGVLAEPARRAELAFPPPRPDELARVWSESPAFAGKEDDYPFYFLPYPSQALTDGSGANLPWLQELGDPMTNVVWGSWLEINPKTAAALGVGEGDVVQIDSPARQIRAPVLLYPAIMPQVVAMPIGQGHRRYGRYASGRGVNPLAILAPLRQSHTDAWAWAATRVRLSRTGERRQLARLGARRPRSLGGIFDGPEEQGSPHGQRRIPIKQI